ncbi:MAG TPA: DUF6580 family putative transport protein [Candidatus Angelobacter sp.]
MADRNVQSSDSNRRTLAAGLVILGAVSRLLPHPPNMTSVGAMGLFAGSRLKKWQALLLPLACMLITDPILAKINGYAAFRWGTLFIYASLMLNVLIGRWLVKSDSPARIGLAAVICSVQFFVVTNFSVWLLDGYYPHTWAGLVACYVAAIPFFQWTFAGDLIYTAVLFGIYALVDRKVLRPAEVPAR